MIDLNEVLTFSEAADKWGFRDGNTLRKAVERNRFLAYEIRKSGNVWLTTYEAMQRVFGQPMNVEYTITYEEIIHIATDCIHHNKNFMDEIQVLYTQALQKLDQDKSIAVVESNKNSHIIARVFTTKEELQSWLEYYGRRITKK